jgi:hypothetical protein
MSRRFTFLLFGTLLGVGLALVMGLAATAPGSAVAQTVSCDTSHSVDGAATPPYGTVGSTISFTATGFTGGEAVSFWFTAPNGAVVGTAQPIPGGVNPNGTIGPLPLTINQSFLDAGEGRWAITFEGGASHHQSVIYFCVFTSADATAIAQPTAAPTATAVAATATTEATAVPTEVSTAVSTEVATATPTEIATAEATSTTGVLPTATTEATAAPPTETPLPPTVPPAPTATIEVVPLPTNVVPGMPTTGNPDGTLPTALALLVIALSIFTAGWLLRRKSGSMR